MSIVNMTVQEALNRKKILEKKWEKQYENKAAYITYATNGQKVVDGVERETIEDILKSQFDSDVHLMKNIMSLKRAISKSNAEQTVTIAGEVYTVADAIAKMNFISSERNFYLKAQKQYNICAANVEKENSKILDPDNIADYLSKINGDTTKIKSEIIEELTENYKEENVLHLINPNNLKDVTTDALKKLDDFEAEVHTVLTTSNINTIIEVEYED